MKNVESCNTSEHSWRLDYLLKGGNAVEAHMNSDDDRHFSWKHKAEFSCTKCYAKAERTLSDDEYQDLLKETADLKEYDLTRNPSYQRHFFRREFAALPGDSK